MGTKQVRLQEDVYAKIADRKRDGESFSETIDRLIDDWSLAEFDMGLTDEQRQTFENAIEDIEATTAENVGDTLAELGDGE